MTNTNYEELNYLYEKYSSVGLEIIAFPCNKFLYQEPGSNDEILEFTRSKNVNFPVMSKVDCGVSSNAHPIFPFLCQKLPDSGLLPGILGNGIKWNFSKFLCDSEGIPLKRYSPNENPKSFESDIVRLLEDREL
mmetsp:Transcript_387/g.722  ORF Transcript_387/g.722 Transcript_387/m.722 type:complete len:134 (+) Transcript_387:216-617(+)